MEVTTPDSTNSVERTDNNGSLLGGLRKEQGKPEGSKETVSSVKPVIIEKPLKRGGYNGDVEWADLFRNLPISSLLYELNPTDKGNHYEVKCPNCGQKEAYIYKNNQGVISCNRKDNCGNTTKVFDYINQRENHATRWDTVIYLHEQAGLEPPRRQPKTDEEVKKDLIKQDFWRICREYLSRSDNEIMRYSQKRGISDDMLENVGYYPGKEKMKDEIQKLGYSWDDVKQEYKFIDSRDTYPFVFQAETPDGPMVIGRRIDNQKDKKYLPFGTYTKKIPFNATSALRNLKKGGSLVIVEGYLDVFRIDSYGIPVVAATTSNLSPNYVKYLKQKKIKKVILMLDNDEAGKKGTLQSIEKLLKAGIQVEVAPELPEAKDPDEFIAKEGIEAFRELLATTLPWWQYKVEQSELPKSFTEKKEALIAIFNKIKGASEQENASHWFAKQLEVDPSAFIEDAKQCLLSNAEELLFGENAMIYEERIISVLTDYFGYNIQRNELNEIITVNGEDWSDYVKSEIFVKMRNLDYRRKDELFEFVTLIAKRNTYNPIKDYFKELVYEGGGHIGKLMSFIATTDDPWFHVIFRKWLIGAIARVFGKGVDTVEPPMLVLTGGQGAGKSVFARWLSSGIPERFYAGPVNPQNKDDAIRLSETFIWEVAELSSTTRKADRDALKYFITMPTVKVRAPYARSAVKKHAYTSFIGTVNDFTGFLDDPTGSRRFNVCEIESINWDYKNEVDINAVWSEAYAAYRSGEDWQLTSVEAKKRNEINREFEMDSYAGDIMREKVRYTGKDSDVIPVARLMKIAKEEGYKGSDRAGSSEIKKALTGDDGIGCRYKRESSRRVYTGCRVI